MLVGEGMKVENTNYANIRTYVWNIAETYWEKLPRRTKPEEFADQCLKMLDYLVSREDLKDEAAAEVIQFDADQRKRTFDRDGS